LSREKLATLEKLQAIDLEIEELRKKADEFPAKLQALEATVAKGRVAADADRKRLDDNEARRRGLDRTIAEEKEKVKKWEARLPGLKHQREYLALQREIESSKKANAFAEEDLLKVKAEAEALKASLKAKDDLLAEHEMDLQTEADALKASEAELRGRIANLAEARETERAAVDKAVLKIYETIRKSRPGKAVVPVAKDTCSGCNRRLAPQQAVRMAQGKTVETCAACGRLLYYAPPPDPVA
jgi:predicted  nucleic acid-binding Zn-ribbon protein